MSKKLLVTLLSVILALSCAGLFACGKTEEPEETSYTITFVAEGVTVGTQTVKEGKYVNPPSDPTSSKANFVFDGWFKDEAFTNEFKFTEKPTSDMTLYAKFIEKIDLTVAVWSKYFAEDYASYLTKIKTDFAAKESKINVLYREYAGEDYDSVELFGAAINAAGDIDVILGSGNNIVSKGGVQGVVAKAAMKDEYKANDRQAALLDYENEYAVALYTMVTGITSETATVTLHGTEGVIASGKLSSILGDKLEYDAPVKSGETFVGWATTESATEAEISAETEITYNTVKSLVKDGAVNLYPVFSVASFDITVYVYLDNGNNKNYITAEESAAMKAAFVAAHPDKKVNWVEINEGNAAAFGTKATEGKADVVIAGNNVGDFAVIAEGDGAKVKLGAGWTANDSRYIAVAAGSENALAIDLWKILTAAKA